MSAPSGMAGDPFGHVATAKDDIGLAYRAVKAERDELLEALLALRQACDAVRPFAGSISAYTVRDALDVKGFIDAVGRADAAIKKATEA